MSKYHILNMEEHKKKYSRDISKISPFDVGIPLVEISDETIQEIYYYRWHTYCSHIRETPLGWVVTEFTPAVPWAGIYNTIVCPAGHHMYEGRWMHDRKYMNDYAGFWFQEGAEPMRYSFWAADAIYAICKVSGDFTLAESLYEKLKENYAKWEEKHLMGNGLFFQIDNQDGMEFSISGNGCRPTINSYMYGDVRALAKIADRLGKTEEKAYYTQKAEALKGKIDALLWDEEACFYKNLKDGCRLADVREEIGYIPWYFNLPDEDKSEAWKFLNDKEYFYAPYGPTTAEQNHPEFMKYFRHECLWNGPSWPFATSQTLTALGNLLHNYKQEVVGKGDYFAWLKLYAGSHYLEENGERIPFIDENLDPYTGEWLARRKMKEWETPRKDADRGIYYNHSSFCDLVISGLAGIRAGEGETLEINPLFEEQDLEYFCADGIWYHGHSITVLWDGTGERYGRGAGLQVYCDGEKKACSHTPGKLVIGLSR